MEDPLFRRLRQHARQRLSDQEGQPREARVPAYRRYRELEETMLARYHQKGDSGLRVTRARAFMMDVLLETICRDATTHFLQRHGLKAAPAEVSIVATGGYGRGELSPLSDIDLLFLFPPKRKQPVYDAYEKEITEEILYPLWDIGLKVGYAVRSIKETIAEARRDIKTRNACLDARRIAGSERLFKRFIQGYNRFVRHDDPHAYALARLEDKRVRHEKYGGSIYLQEPEIKNGVGGLRDFQSILWMAHIILGVQGIENLQQLKFLSEDQYRKIVRAYDFLLRVRTELHLQSQRPTDLLTLEIQPQVALKLGYRQRDIFRRVEIFMRDYYRAARNIHLTTRLMETHLLRATPPGRSRIPFRNVIEAHSYHRRQVVDGFLLREKIFTAESGDVFRNDPERLVRIFRHAQQYGARLDPELQDLIACHTHLITNRMIRSESANRAFRSILQTTGQVADALFLMHELGVLGRFIPEFGELTCLVQHEYYHRYTADIHVLNTIRQLDRVFEESNPEAARYREALRDLDTPKLLYLILLLHDIGKSEGIKGHAEIGARIAKPVLERLGVPENLHRKILFIIRNHLEMARFWQKFDVDDPRTIRSFADLVESSEHLCLLYVHTYCDAQGTAAGLWNGYKDSLHTQLYRNTRDFIEDQRSPEERSQERKMVCYQEVVDLPPEGISKEEIEAHFNLLPERYFIHSGRDEIHLHLRMINQLLRNIQEADSIGSLVPVIDWQNDLDQSMTVVNIVTWDRSGLFCKLAGAFSVAGLNILSSKAISRSDHITIDTFYVVEPGGGVVQDDKAMQVFEASVTDALLHNKDLSEEIRQTAKKRAAASRFSTSKEERLPAPIPPKVDVYHELSLKRTIIEIQAPDHLGLLFHLSKAIYEAGFDITFARIGTENGVAMDTFYIESIRGGDEARTTGLLNLQESLNRIVAEHT
ncbi:MAG: [protein-PII] uridylyltransferase [Opitutales bacterium]